jgi:hypothetical protein
MRTELLCKGGGRAKNSSFGDHHAHDNEPMERTGCDTDTALKQPILILAVGAVQVQAVSCRLVFGLVSTAAAMTGIVF